MDFFAHQDWARRNTRWLVWTFIAAVIVLVAAMNLVVQAVVQLGDAHLRDSDLFALHALVSLGTMTVIAGGSWFKSWQLRAGGSRVAQMVGGTPLTGDLITDQRERVLLNVVEEMAIASGVPMPAVYVLRDEATINAFAAGHDPAEAVIAVTRGCLERLSRDELQGVVAHEFSHILNGDMRLNMRLMAVLHGILLIGLIGYYIVRGLGRGRVRVSGKKGGGGIVVILLIGLAMMVLGSLGTLIGKLIKCGISRQREFLADASAVQFTRHPEGIVGALKKIGNHYVSARIRHENAAQASHMFIGDAVGRAWISLLATHPPMEQRIRAIDPNWDGMYPFVEPTSPVAPEYRSDPELNKPQFAPVARMRADAPTLRQRVGTISPAHVAFGAALLSSLPERIKAATEIPFSARAIVASLLLDPDAEKAEAQVRALIAFNDEAVMREIRKLAPLIRTLGPGARLPLVDLCVPTLRQLSPDQHHAFATMLQALISSGGPVNLNQYVLYKNLMTHLVPPARQRPIAKYYSVKPVLPHIVALLSAVARAGSNDEQRVRDAFSAGCAKVIDSAPTLSPVSRAECGPKELDYALDQLNQLNSGMKLRLVTACAHCISADGMVTVDEAELLRLVSSCLGCPMPPFLS